MSHQVAEKGLQLLRLTPRQPRCYDARHLCQYPHQERNGPRRVEGGETTYNGEQMPIYDAAMKHKADGTPLIVVGGKEYGTGSSRDWAAKGTILLGVCARLLLKAYERIHRSNLMSAWACYRCNLKMAMTRETRWV